MFIWNPHPSGYLVAHPPVSGLWHSATRSPPFPPHVRADTFTTSPILPSWRLQYSSNSRICPCTLFSQLAFPFRHLLFCSDFRLLPLCHPCLTPRVFFTFAPPTHPDLLLVMTTLFYMPMPYSRDAPQFSSDPLDFTAFFDDVSELARRAGLSDADAISWAIRYGH